MSGLNRLCLRIDDTGVKLLGGDLVRSDESLLIKVFGVSDSGNIPVQEMFSINVEVVRVRGLFEEREGRNYR